MHPTDQPTRPTTGPNVDRTTPERPAQWSRGDTREEPQLSYPGLPSDHLLNVLRPERLVVQGTIPHRGYDAVVRTNITEVRIGCQTIMIRAGEGVVEVWQSVDPAGEWYALDPDAAMKLSRLLRDAAKAVRLLTGNRGGTAAATGEPEGSR